MFGIPVFIRNKAPKLIFDRFLNEISSLMFVLFSVVIFVNSLNPTKILFCDVIEHISCFISSPQLPLYPSRNMFLLLQKNY